MLVGSDFSQPQSAAYLQRFDASNAFSAPTLQVRQPGAGAVKFHTFYNTALRQLWYYTWHNSGPNDYHPNVYIWDDNGAFQGSSCLTFYDAKKHYGVPHYPHLAIDPLGNIYAAWTTVHSDRVQDAGGALYRSIHFIMHRDGTWQSGDGTPVTLPVVGDDTGPAQSVLTPGEYNMGVSNWLSNMLWKEDKLHFLYLRGIDGRQKYVRWDLASGKRDIDRVDLGGETLSLLGQHGFCATTAHVPRSKLVCVGKRAGASDELAALVSYDNGSTWSDYATVMLPAVEGTLPQIYGITGARELTDEGDVIGLFARIHEPTVAYAPADIYFFRISATR